MNRKHKYLEWLLTYCHQIVILLESLIDADVNASQIVDIMLTGQFCTI